MAIADQVAGYSKIYIKFIYKYPSIQILGQYTPCNKMSKYYVRELKHILEIDWGLLMPNEPKNHMLQW